MDKFFTALLKEFRHFIARDLVFFVSGGAVVGAFLYCFSPWLPPIDDHWVVFALLASIGYFVAFALQEGFSIVGIVTTGYLTRPPPWVIRRYVKASRRNWVRIAAIPHDRLDRIRENLTENQQRQLERIVAHKQIGTAGGPSIIVCGVLFFLRWWLHWWLRWWCVPFDPMASIGALIVGCVLICIGWVKGAQEAQFIAQRGRVSGIP